MEESARYTTTTQPSRDYEADLKPANTDFFVAIGIGLTGIIVGAYLWRSFFSEPKICTDYRLDKDEKDCGTRCNTCFMTKGIEEKVDENKKDS